MPPLASNHAEPKNFQSSEIVRERRGCEEREKQPVRIVNSSMVHSWAEPSLLDAPGHSQKLMVFVPMKPRVQECIDFTCNRTECGPWQTNAVDKKSRDTRVGHDGLIEEIGHTGAAIEAKEIEAQHALQLRHAHDRWPLDIELLQDRQILAEHRVVVHLCPGTQNWFLETERLPRPGLCHFGGKFAPQLVLMAAGRLDSQSQKPQPKEKNGKYLCSFLGDLRTTSPMPLVFEPSMLWCMPLARC